MKKHILIYGWLLISPLSLLAQEIKESVVPVAVKNSLTAKFPNATDVDWKKTGNQYNASFDLGKVEHDALFTASGQLVAHEYDIADAELPADVKMAIARQFPAYRIDGADKREEGGQLTYKVELDGTPDLTVIMTGNGKLLKKKVDND